jgi:hypothetical protein
MDKIAEEDELGAGLLAFTMVYQSLQRKNETIDFTKLRILGQKAAKLAQRIVQTAGVRDEADKMYRIEQIEALKVELLEAGFEGEDVNRVLSRIGSLGLGAPVVKGAADDPIKSDDSASSGLHVDIGEAVERALDLSSAKSPASKVRAKPGLTAVMAERRRLRDKLQRRFDTADLKSLKESQLIASLMEQRKVNRQKLKLSPLSRARD